METKWNTTVVKWNSMGKCAPWKCTVWVVLVGDNVIIYHRSSTRIRWNVFQKELYVENEVPKEANLIRT